MLTQTYRSAKSITVCPVKHVYVYACVCVSLCVQNCSRDQIRDSLRYQLCIDLGFREQIWYQRHEIHTMKNDRKQGLMFQVRLGISLISDQRLDQILIRLVQIWGQGVNSQIHENHGTKSDRKQGLGFEVRLGIRYVNNAPW